jgi:hypothetical protein
LAHHGWRRLKVTLSISDFKLRRCCFDDALRCSPQFSLHFSVPTTDFGKALFFERDGRLYPLLQLPILGISVPPRRSAMRQFEPLLNLGSRFFALV